MKPPEIYLKFSPSFHGEFIDCEASKIDRDGFEKYHLAPVDPCIWSGGGEDDYDVWESSCNKSWILNEGTPKDNDMNFCPFCGMVLETRLPESPKESEKWYPVEDKHGEISCHPNVPKESEG